MSNSGNILDQWAEIKTLIESLDLDIVKNASGNASAGVRARRGLRLLKSKSAELVKKTIAEENGTIYFIFQFLSLILSFLRSLCRS